MVTGEGLVTEAVKVTTVPAVTEEADRASVVVVGVPARATGAASMAMIPIIVLRRIDTWRCRRLREDTSEQAEPFAGCIKQALLVSMISFHAASIIRSPALATHVLSLG
jgi:hypothetical protein